MDFLHNEVEYIKVNNLEELKEDLVNRDFMKTYVEYFIIITKSNRCRVHSINREFDKHDILQSEETKIGELEMIGFAHTDVEGCISFHMESSNHEDCEIF